MRDHQLALLVRGRDQRVDGRLIVIGKRAADDDLDVVRALGDPIGDEALCLARSCDQPSLTDAGEVRVQAARRDRGQPGAAEVGVANARAAVTGLPAPVRRRAVVSSGTDAMSSAVVTP